MDLIAFMTSVNPDLPVHSPTLISVYTVCRHNVYGFYIMLTTAVDLSDCADVQADLSILAHKLNHRTLKFGQNA